MDEQEKAAELEAQQQVKEEEVRARIITDFGFNEVDDAERIDKLVKHEVAQRTKLSTAIGQKIKYRTEAETLKATPPKPAAPAAPTVPPEEIGKLVTQGVSQELEKRDLDALEYPEELKAEIQRIARITNTSIKQALRDPYLATKIGEYEKEQKAGEAAISRTNRSSGKKSYSLESPPDVDMATPEGRKAWDDYTEWAKKQ